MSTLLTSHWLQNGSYLLALLYFGILTVSSARMAPRRDGVAAQRLLFDPLYCVGMLMPPFGFLIFFLVTMVALPLPASNGVTILLRVFLFTCLLLTLQHKNDLSTGICTRPTTLNNFMHEKCTCGSATLILLLTLRSTASRPPRALAWRTLGSRRSGLALRVTSYLTFFVAITLDKRNLLTFHTMVGRVWTEFTLPLKFYSIYLIPQSLFLRLAIIAW